MADYNSQYTGTEIESAITKVLTGPVTDDSTLLYAVGFASSGNTYNLLKKSNIKFVDAGGIDCTNITCGTFVTKSSLQLKQTNTSIPNEGGQLDFYDTTNTLQGCIDLNLKGTDWNLRMFKPGTELLNLSLYRGQLTVCNRERGLMWISTRYASFISPYSHSGGGAVGHLSMKTPSGAWSLCTYNTEALYFVYGSDTNFNNSNNSTKNVSLNSAGVIQGATMGDYAETRITSTNKPGICVSEMGDGTLKETTERLQRGCHIISDTYGMVIGPQKENYNPIAITGRVLTYIYEGREEATKHIGWPVCSGPNGTVSIMTEEEEQKYPSRIIGTISEIPTYEIWEDNEIEVNGRIWVHVR